VSTITAAFIGALYYFFGDQWAAQPAPQQAVVAEPRPITEDPAPAAEQQAPALPQPAEPAQVAEPAQPAEPAEPAERIEPAEHVIAEAPEAETEPATAAEESAPAPQTNPVATEAGRDEPAEKKLAAIRVTSRPPGAEILLDGKLEGTTPTAVDGLGVGRHQLQLRAPGYEPYRRTIDLGEGAHSKLDISLVAVPRKTTPRSPSSPSTLKVESEPRGALVRVNGRPRGSAPLEIDDLAAGSYQVVVEFPGVPPQTRTVNLAGGGSTHTITFRLQR
jgi:hypothetical protein